MAQKQRPTTSTKTLTSLAKKPAPKTPSKKEVSYPWEKKGSSPPVKIMAFLGLVALLCFIFNAGMLIITTLATVIADPAQLLEPLTLIGALFLSGLLPLAIIGLCLFGVIKLWRVAFTPGDFKPKVGPVAAGALGQQFEVRYSRPLGMRSFGGKGAVRFQDEVIELDGTLPPNIWLQLGIVAGVTLVPLLLFGIGLGIIPALIIAGLVGKEDRTRTVPYQNILNLTIKEHRVTLTATGETPKQFKFTVASTDGERLYRELYHHYPTTVAQWQSKLEEMVKELN